jgi:hypothetical protein
MQGKESRIVYHDRDSLGKSKVEFFKVVNLDSGRKCHYNVSILQIKKKELKIMAKTVYAQSGHTLWVNKIDPSDISKTVKDSEYFKGFTIFWEVRNLDSEGVLFFYLAKGGTTKNQICVFYRNGGFWSSYGKTIEEAINGAQRDGWLYT